MLTAPLIAGKAFWGWTIIEILNDDEEDKDFLYVYNEGADASEIALIDNGDGTQTITADREIVALIQSSLTLTGENVVLYERGSDDTALI